jgi:hypothetical protein
MTKTEKAIMTLKALVALLESGHEVIRFEGSFSLGEPVSIGPDGSDSSNVISLKIELIKDAK